MTGDDLRRLIVGELRKVAPEADAGTLAGDAPLRDVLDIDSFDFLRVLVALGAATGVEVPERDYGRLATLDGMVQYFENRQ